MRVRLLGPIDVVADGEIRPVPGIRRKAVLAALALPARQVVSTDRLVDIVWGDTAPASAVNSLQNHVGFLRRVLGDRLAIRTQPPGYVLDLGGAATDVEDAEQSIRQGLRASDPEARTKLLQAAVDLWRGRALPEVACLAWFEDQAQRLDQVLLQARQALAESRLAMGQHHEVVAELETLRGEYPLHEEIHRLLMLALYRSGRQADALARYHELRIALDQDLGIGPSPSLHDLHGAILRQDPSITTPDPVPVTVAAPGGPAQLPLSVASFAGRDDELARLDDLLVAAEADPVRSTAVVISTVSGTAGVGKTALALQWAHRVAGRFPGGQLYVNLRGFDPGEPAMDPADAIRSFLDAFAVPAARIPTGRDAQAGLYRTVLAGKRVLVVLDNARDEQQVRPLLPGSPGCFVVVTSRNRLAGLAAAEGAHPLDLDLPSAAEARAILVRRVGTARAAAEPAAVDDIIASCARLPLALAVTAARAATKPALPLAVIAAQLHDDVATLDRFPGGDRATDIRATFARSYQVLSPDAAMLFRRLGLCPGQDTALAAAASLAGLAPPQVRPILDELTRMHLVGEHTHGRYGFHDLLRAYAREQVEAHDSDPDRDAATHRLMDHYLHTAHRAATLLSPLRDQVPLAPPHPGVTVAQLGDQGHARVWFIAEHAGLLAAVGRAPHRFDEQVWQLATTLYTYLDRYGHPHDNIAIQTAGLTAAQRLGDRRAQAYAHRSLGFAAIQLDRFADAEAHNGQALRLFQEIGNPAAGAQVHLNLSSIAHRRADFAEAVRQSRLALRLFQSAGHRLGRALAMNNVGWNLAHLGDHRRALSYCRRATLMFNEAGDCHSEAAAGDSLGYIYFHLNDPHRAVACYQRSIELYRQTGDLQMEADTFINLADGHDRAGNSTAAHRARQHALLLLGHFDNPAAARIRARTGRRHGTEVRRDS